MFTISCRSTQKEEKEELAQLPATRLRCANIPAQNSDFSPATEGG